MSWHVQPPPPPPETHQVPKYTYELSQIYALEQQLQSTSYLHYLHLSCDVKLKSYSIFTFEKIANIFCDFLLKKTFAKEKISIN